MKQRGGIKGERYKKNWGKWSCDTGRFCSAKKTLETAVSVWRQCLGSRLVETIDAHFGSFTPEAELRAPTLGSPVSRTGYSNTWQVLCH